MDEFEDTIGLSLGVFIGILAGGVLLIILFLILLCFCCGCCCFAAAKRSKRNKRSPERGQQQSPVSIMQQQGSFNYGNNAQKDFNGHHNNMRNSPPRQSQQLAGSPLQNPQFSYPATHLMKQDSFLSNNGGQSPRPILMNNKPQSPIISPQENLMVAPSYERSSKSPTPPPKPTYTFNFPQQQAWDEVTQNLKDQFVKLKQDQKTNPVQQQGNNYLQQQQSNSKQIGQNSEGDKSKNIPTPDYYINE